MLDNIPKIHLPETPQESPPQLQELPSPLAPSPLQNLPEKPILGAATDVSSQSTPTNGLFREIMKNESGLGIKADEDESQAVLHSFREQFGEGANPKDVLVVVEKSSHLDGGGYYLCFRLAYPLAANRVEALWEYISTLYLLLDRPVPSRTDPLRDLPDAGQQRSLKSSLFSFRHRMFFYQPYLDRTSEADMVEWTSKVEKARNAIHGITQTWTELKADISQMKELLGTLQTVSQNMDSLLGMLKAEMVHLKKDEETSRIAYEGMLSPLI